MARHFGIASADTICIGDELRDIEAARSAGMDSGAVAWGYAFPAALQTARPTYLFSSMAEIAPQLAADDSVSDVGSRS